MGNQTKQNFLKRRHSNSQKTHEKMLTICSHKENANQNHTKIPSHPCETSHHQKHHHHHQMLARMWGKEPSHTAGGNGSYCNHSLKKIWRLLKI
jgi:hypothetical protein